MRLTSLVSLIILGLCLAYARHLQPAVPDPASYNGPATFVSLVPDDATDPNPHWVLVCVVDGARMAFSANDARVRRQAASLRPGQAVTICYDLPATPSSCGYAQLGPPVFRTIKPAGAADGSDRDDGDALALDTSDGP